MEHMYVGESSGRGESVGSLVGTLSCHFSSPGYVPPSQLLSQINQSNRGQNPTSFIHSINPNVNSVL